MWINKVTWWLKNGISLRLRLTLITSILLTALCVVFTIFTIYNANHSIQAVTITQSAQEAPEGQKEPQRQEDIQELEIPTEQGVDSSMMLETVPAVDTVNFSRISFLFMGVAIVIGSVLMYFVSGIILKPLKRLSDTVEEIDRDSLNTRITEFHAGDELNELSDSFNGMLERLDDAFAREKRFSVDAAHELKTPLSVIKTTIEVMDSPSSENGSLNVEEYSETIAVVKSQTERMISLVNQLFELSSMNVNKKDEAVSISKLVEEIKGELSTSLEEKNMVLLTEPSNCTVRGDSLLLKHGILNVIQNAVKYGTSGGKIQVITEDDSNNILLEIKDWGMGIPEEKRENIFEPFFRVDRSRSRAVGGAGLGLAITKEIVELHGGRICCLPNEPTGTIFRIQLPKK